MIETDHPQVNISFADKFATVDVGMAGPLLAMWKLGMHTQYSCQDNYGLAYVCMDRKSSRLFEKALRKRVSFKSVETQMMADLLLATKATHEVRLRLDRKDWYALSFNLRLGRRIRARNHVSIERTYQRSPHGFRTTYRWPHKMSPIMLKMLEELAT